MKYILFTFIFLLSAQNFYAQFNPYPRNISNMLTVDSGSICIWYAFNATDINDTNTYDDLQRLEIGRFLSKNFSHFIYTSDSLCTYDRKTASFMSAGFMGKSSVWSEYRWSEFFKDFSKNLFTEYARMAMRIPCYQYSEEIPVQNWDIQDDTMTVVGYLSQKATCRFRGRNYTAWFTPAIPINNGPWKFGGLPGLILKVYDEDSQYVYECVKVETVKEKYPIKIFDYRDYKKIEREKLLKLVKKVHEDYEATAGLISNSGGKLFSTNSTYYPRELE
jgi:GLPGLI family protein